MAAVLAAPALQTHAVAPQPLHRVVSGLAPQTLDRGQYFFSKRRQ